MNPISVWLNGSRSYDVGLNLFADFGHDDFLLNQFSRNRTEFNFERMVELLKGLQLPELTVDAAKVEGKHLLQPGEYSKLREGIKVFYDSIVKSLKIQGARTTKLRVMVKDALKLKDINKANAYMKQHGAEDLVHEVLDTDDELQVMYERFEEWRKTGILPAGTVDHSLDDFSEAELMKLLQNKRSFVSKQKNNGARKKEVDDALVLIASIERRLRDAF